MSDAPVASSIDAPVASSIDAPDAPDASSIDAPDAPDASARTVTRDARFIHLTDLPELCLVSATSSTSSSSTARVCLCDVTDTRVLSCISTWLCLQADLGDLLDVTRTMLLSDHTHQGGTYSTVYRWLHKQKYATACTGGLCSASRDQLDTLQTHVTQYVGMRILHSVPGTHMLRLRDGTHVDQALVAANALHVANIAASRQPPPTKLVLNLTPGDNDDRASLPLNLEHITLFDHEVPLRHVQFWECGGVHIGAHGHEELVCDASMLMRLVYEHQWVHLRARLTVSELRRVSTQLEHWFVHIVYDTFDALLQFHTLTNMVHNDASLGNMIVFPGERTLPDGLTGPNVDLRLADFDLAWPAQSHTNLFDLSKVFEFIELELDFEAQDALATVEPLLRRTELIDNAPRRFIVDYCTACLNLIVGLEVIAPQSRFCYRLRFVAAQFLTHALEHWFVNQGGEIGKQLANDLAHFKMHGEFLWTRRKQTTDIDKFELRLLPINTTANLDRHEAHHVARQLWNTHWSG